MSADADQRTSKMSGFHNLTREEKVAKVYDFTQKNQHQDPLTQDDTVFLYELTGHNCDCARKVDEASLNELEGNYFDHVTSRLSENAITTKQFPYSITPNMKVNGKDYLIPMAIEESSVVATIGNISRFAREGEGIISKYISSEMIGQIQMSRFKDEGEAYKAMDIIKANEQDILKIANVQDPILVKHGGGARRIAQEYLDSKIGPMVVTELHVDTGYAMGANAVNTMCEAVAPFIEDITGAKVFLRILTNLAERRVVQTDVKVKTEDFVKKDFPIEAVIEGINNADAFAWASSKRASTHNKGIMNGVDAVAIATGQDFRALEAGAHSYAARNGRYEPLSTWHADEDYILGSLSLPMAVGTVGGASAIDRLVQTSYKILDLERGAYELGEVIAATGAIQNLGALRALAMEGINKGHMKLHSDNMAMAA
ncbi:MAG: hydroxymethylglutaryl-CoA reductase, degradative, partial [Candidatus Aenigmarchaeota archaeon]|nr:hydroxymethylglutaryl-CoA reductase, degradative [Candidatus Aenigmarchaeota archaeon]